MKKLCLITVFLLSSLFFGQDVKPFFNESMVFHVVWKGMHMGTVVMKTKTKPEKKVLRAFSTIKTFKLLQNFYYIGGYFGAEWNYAQKKPVRAFEEVYQGKHYQKRAFLFKGDKVLVVKHEKKFKEYNYPHTQPIKDEKKKEWIQAPGYQDLLGAFYYMRAAGRTMRVGEVTTLKVLPAGSKKKLILKILAKKTVSTKPFGKKTVYHVRSGLMKADGKPAQGGNIFLKTKSPIDMYITDDANRLPVKIWATLPYVGRLEVQLVKYSQP
ncbi:MAG: DUF3108 domain-containing protein [Candidatus Hydrogenedentota bacterium]|nr:MAG: DUF3108 domain-containing protein [Candidatus Hydrogenedentota bacterium]